MPVGGQCPPRFESHGTGMAAQAVQTCLEWPLWCLVHGKDDPIDCIAGPGKTGRDGI